jgi:hypothetical protein
MKRSVVPLVVAIFAVAAQLRAANPLTQQWVQIFHDPHSTNCVPTAIAVDSHNNVFITGHEVVSNGYPFYNIVTLKYSPSGVPLWTNYYDGPAQLLDQPYAMALDRAGNVFVTGLTQIDSGPLDFNYVTIKYSNDGLPLWTNYYNGLTNADAQAITMAIDPSSGAVSVSGISITTNYFFEYATINYSNNGVPLWTNSFTAYTNFPFYDAWVQIAAGKNEKVFMSGTVSNDASGDDIVTVAYSRNGLPLWTNYYNDPTNGNDRFADIAVDSHDNVIVMGSSEGNLVTISYSAVGTPLWTNVFPSLGTAGIAVNSRGDIFLPGNSRGFPSVAYKRNGNVLWTNVSPHSVTGVATEFYRGFFTIGTSPDPLSGFNHMALIEYSSSGIPLSTNLYDGPANSADLPLALAVGPGGDVYVTGYYGATLGGLDMITLKYSRAKTNVSSR